MFVEIGPYCFPIREFDAVGDLLMLRIERGDALSEETPEGHHLRLRKPDGHFVGVTLDAPVKRLRDNGTLDVTLPDGVTYTLTADDLHLSERCRTKERSVTRHQQVFSGIAYYTIGGQFKGHSVGVSGSSKREIMDAATIRTPPGTQLLRIAIEQGSTSWHKLTGWSQDHRALPVIPD